jgi:hypothetical protein
VTNNSELTVRVVHDHDGDCSVSAKMAGPFGGTGLAWLNIADVSGFALSVGKLAKTSQGEALIQGGYYNKDGSAHHTLRLHLVPHGPRGHVLVTADLASDPASNAQAQIICKMSAAMIVEPMALEGLAAALANIPKGGEAEAKVEGESAA